MMSANPDRITIHTFTNSTNVFEERYFYSIINEWLTVFSAECNVHIDFG